MFYRSLQPGRAALEAAVDPRISPPNELPSYRDSEYNDSHTVEVSAYQEPLAFAPFCMQGAGVNEPAEMDAHASGEESDQWGSLSGESGLGLGIGGDALRQPDSPWFSEVSRESVGSPSPGTASPLLGQGGRSPDLTRTIRQTEVSRVSYGSRHVPIVATMAIVFAIIFFSEGVVGLY